MKNRGFTLIELLVVIAVIGLLASIILVNTTGTTNKARIAKTLEYSSQVYNALGSEAVGVWNFDEGTGTVAYDSSGYANNGTIYNGAFYATDTPQAVVGSGTDRYSIYFDGVDDYVRIPQAIGQSVNNLPSCTIEAWVKPSVVDSTQRFAVSIKNTTSNTRMSLGISSSNKAYGLFRSDNEGSQGGVSKAVLSANTWYHVAVVPNLSSQTITVYLNGTATVSTGKSFSNSSFQNNTHATNGYIGLYAASNQTFNGFIDDVRIYNTALSAMEIQQHYVEGLARHKDLAIKQ